MNRERVEYCIELMENVDRNNFCMNTFQGFGNKSTSAKLKVATNIEILHNCGNSACFAGYVALSKKFQEDGGIVSDDLGGAPIFEDQVGYMAIAQYLDITDDTAEGLVSGCYWSNDDFYPVEFSEVKPEHVIEKLKLILSGELL